MRLGAQACGEVVHWVWIDTMQPGLMVQMRGRLAHGAVGFIVPTSEI